MSAPSAPPLLDVAGLHVELPDGRILLEDVSLTVAPGEIVVLLGGSGAGKSTFSRVLFEREAMVREGFRVRASRLAVEPSELGLVPQRGALFDHLSVAENLELARRYGTGRGAAPPAAWLERVGLEPALAAGATPVSRLSGGQAQRLAVARVLAGGRRLLFLDEPSIGLDPLRVRQLARLLRAQADDHGSAAIVVTHDVAFAAGVADKLYVLDPATRRFVPLWADTWAGPVERAGVDEATRGGALVELEAALNVRIGQAAAPAAPAAPRATAALGRALATRARRLLAPLAMIARALVAAPAQLAQHPLDFARIFGRVALQTVARPLLFYAVVSTLVGYTVLYVISKVGGAGVRPDAGVRLVGGSVVIALAPVLSAVLFVAASGNAVNAWLGAMGLSRQVLALRALGVAPIRYLAAPSVIGTALGSLAIAATVAVGMFVGGAALCAQLGMPGGFAGGWALLTADVTDPSPERAPYLVRALCLVWLYAWGTAATVVAEGLADKREADDVTAGMTRAVVACTLWVVALELGSALVVLGA